MSVSLNATFGFLAGEVQGRAIKEQQQPQNHRKWHCFDSAVRNQDAPVRCVCVVSRTRQQQKAAQHNDQAWMLFVYESVQFKVYFKSHPRETDHLMRQFDLRSAREMFI